MQQFADSDWDCSEDELLGEYEDDELEDLQCVETDPLERAELAELQDEMEQLEQDGRDTDHAFCSTSSRAVSPDAGSSPQQGPLAPPVNS